MRHRVRRGLVRGCFAILLFFCISGYSKPAQESWTDRTLKSLSLREMIAQLIQIRVPGKFLNRRSSEFQGIRQQIVQNRIGGVVLFAGNVYESALLLNELQTTSKLPLLVSADFERGAAFRIADTTSFPWAMALGATGSEKLAYRQGLITAQESRALGVHWIFAPVLDVNSNPDNPVINIRSFGEDPGLVSRLGSSFIQGAKKGGVLTVAKHFPGHGDTSVDSHIGLPVIESDLERLQSIELAPFRSAIEAGVDSIMTAHIAVPRITGERATPATLSPQILTDLLRNRLKFPGIVVTDALEMAGVTDHFWCGLAAVRALQAGADVLLLPPDAAVAINEIERAVQRGDISRQRIEQSARKILDAKSRLGLQRTRLVSINDIGDIVASPQNTNLAREIAERSITAPKDERHLIPIDILGDTRVFSLVLAPDLESSPGALFQTEMRKRFPAITTAWGNARINDELIAIIDNAVAQSDLIVCSIWVRLGSGQDANSIPESQRAIIKKLIASHKPIIWVSFGNPYALRLVPEISTSLCVFSYSEASQIAAARALSGEIEITGRMPVTIPQCAKAGDGLRIPKTEMTLTPAFPDAFGPPGVAFANTRQLLIDAVKSKAIPGARLVAGYQGKIALDLAVGSTSFKTDAAAVASDTIYDIGSLSRIIRTACGIMLASESGSLILDTPIRDYVPELKGADRRHIRELLEALSVDDGNETAVIDTNIGILETIVSRTTGLALDRFTAKRLFEPLGMHNTFHNPPKSSGGGIAGFEKSGKAPLFCTAKDLAAFAQMMLNRGTYNHHRLLSPAAVARHTGKQGPFSKPSNKDWTGNLLSASAFGRNSSGGSFIWIDPAKKLFIVLLANGRRQSQADVRIDELQRMVVESILANVISRASAKP
jgi:beta-N-acetylhexosaminidase